MYLHFTVIQSIFHNIKLFNTEKYMYNDLDTNNKVILGDVKKADKYFIFWQEDNALKKFIAVSGMNNKFLSIEIQGNQLTYEDLNPDIQLFIINPEDFYDRSYKIVKDGLCLTWIEDKKKFALGTCNDEDRYQMFEILKEDFDYSKLNEIDKDLKKKESILKPFHHNTEFAALKNHDILESVYRSLYDISLCLGNTGICHPRNDLCADESKVMSIRSTSSSYAKSSGFTS